MKIYMDVCCLNRPFDNQSQSRVRLESQAVIAILNRCAKGEWEIVGSEIIDMELAKCRNSEKLRKVRGLYSIAKNHLLVTREVETRASALQSGGIKMYDSLHLALAETYRTDVFLTTDDDLFAASRRIGTAVKVMNPVMCFMEAE